ncbi:MAG: Uroporphyrinogen methyltransferase / synthase [Hydrocarboniphaga sp.]|uniref:uroporphyrinogen-III C-methyltransferase n=1 Tax=Hydrocarboniphaga sp. TaxID=2033016 RepID=UPI00262AAD80|nr:uroporphyrinogen-III C-methyltransferase [Hydrocarboniphaga sp.]MDB5969300.1 Uroporphyrinogen methyltransferase / synthase [Hydrocarboniphaga sp.]
MKSKASLPLKGLRVIVTRPDLQAGNLSLLLEAQGAEAARLPVFAIAASGDDEASRAILSAHRDDDGWIFTSANAVRYAAEIDGRDAGWPSLFAVGGATAAALAAVGHPGAIWPEQRASSEALLQLPPLQDAAGKRYLIVAGEDGRELIATGLAARGAQVDTLSLYRRRPLEHDEARIEAEIALADAIVITSGETLERLWLLTPEALRPSLLALKLVVPSPRVLEKALALGFTAPLLPETVSDDAIVHCLGVWRKGQVQDLSMSSPNPPDAADNDAEVSASAGAVPPISVPSVPPLASMASETRDVSASPKSSGGAIAWLLVLLLAGALGYGGWLLWDLRANQASLLQAQDHALRRLTRQAAELDNLTSQTATRQSDLARVLQRSGSDLAAMQGRLDNSEQLMGRMTEELQGGRTRFALASVEQLMLLANDRLLLEHDVRSALLALQIADERLGALNDPRLFRVREAIARERAQLQALPRPDLTSASLTLSSLIDRADSLPLRARVEPRQFGGARPGSAGSDAGARWYERVWASVRSAVASLFVIRREDNAASLRLLPAEDEAVIVHVLILKLESARVALLRGETASFREVLGSAADWLRQFFRADDPGVEAALGEIERLQALELSAPPPELSGSLTLLRQVLAPNPQ